MSCFSIAYEKPQGTIVQEQGTTVGIHEEKTDKSPRHRPSDSKDSLILPRSASDRRSIGMTSLALP